MIAPELIMGLCGIPSGFTQSSLKLRPLGSLPTKRCTNSSPCSCSASMYERGLLADWMEKSTSHFPMLSFCPSIEQKDMPSTSGSASANSGMYPALAPDLMGSTSWKISWFTDTNCSQSRIVSWSFKALSIRAVQGDTTWLNWSKSRKSTFNASRILRDWASRKSFISRPTSSSAAMKSSTLTEPSVCRVSKSALSCRRECIEMVDALLGPCRLQRELLRDIRSRL
mmetsp:Transcript_37571/g.73954  ORF Transcript_37571/g.73954 Transcript_37571/m.73954 type:complete len:226 (+) Transcript_37571:434-1111(+)